MAVREQLTSLVAALGRVPAATVTPEARLGDLGIGSSIAIGMLQARLRDAFGAAPGSLSWKSTVAEIERALTKTGGASGHQSGRPEGRPARANRETPLSLEPSTALVPATSSDTVMGIGLDLEDIASLPPMGDPFYVDHFTQAEVAAAAAAADPRAHLCGIWCAKEAAIKAVPALRHVAITQIEITNETSGAPAIRILDAALAPGLPRLELSITHTAASAAAVVIALTRR
jgi:holo-[acyl-carrier protein] synthase